MNSLYYHHLKSLSLTLLTFLSLMVLLLVIGSAAQFLALAVENGLSLSIFLRLLASLLPAQTATIFPLCLLAACVTTFISQTNAGEFSVLRAAGISESSYFRPALLFGGILALIYAILTFYIAPISEQNLKSIELESAASISQNTIINAREPVLFNGIEIFVNSTDQALLNQASFFRQSSAQTVGWYFAETAQFFKGPNGLSLLLDKSQLANFSGQSLSSYQRLDRAIIDLGLTNSGEMSNIPPARIKYQTLSQLAGNFFNPIAEIAQETRAEIFIRGAYTVLVLSMPSWTLLWLLWARHGRGRINHVTYVGPITLILAIMTFESMPSDINFGIEGLVVGWAFLSAFYWAGPLYFAISHMGWNRSFDVKKETAP